MIGILSIILKERDDGGPALIGIAHKILKGISNNLGFIVLEFHLLAHCLGT